MIYVADLESSELPQEFVDVLPKYCDHCGSYTEITESLTILRCANPKCIEKSVQRLVALLKDLDVKTMGEAKCRKFLSNFGVDNPYCIFMYEPSDGVLFEGASQDFSDDFYHQLGSKRKMMLWEYVRLGNLPGIRDSARKLLSDYDDLEEFYDDLESGGIAFVQEALDIKGKVTEADNIYDEDETVSVKAVDTYNTLIAFKEELFQALDFVEIKKITTPMINLCISTAVGKPFRSKSDFVTQMNDIYGEKVHLNFLGSVSKDIQFLIWSKEGSITSKVKKTMTINDKRRAQNIADGRDPDEGLINVMTGEEFRDFLEAL